MEVKATEEQAAARDAFTAGRDLALVAGAGTGKTSTLVMMGAASRHRGMYIAFNKPIAQEAKARFGTNVHCSTSHGLAYRAVGSRSGLPRHLPRLGAVPGDRSGCRPGGPGQSETSQQFPPLRIRQVRSSRTSSCSCSSTGSGAEEMKGCGAGSTTGTAGASPTIPAGEGSSPPGCCAVRRPRDHPRPVGPGRRPVDLLPARAGVSSATMPSTRGRRCGRRSASPRRSQR